MAIRALITSTQTTMTHPSEDSIPPENRVKFIFQALSSRANAFVRDQTVEVSMVPDPDNPGEQKAQVNTKNGLSMLLTAQYGLIGIDNFFSEDADGNLTEVKVETEVINLGGGAKWTCIKQKYLDMLPDSIRVWCSRQVQELNNVKEEDVKNSEE